MSLHGQYTKEEQELVNAAMEIIRSKRDPRRHEEQCMENIAKMNTDSTIAEKRRIGLLRYHANRKAEKARIQKELAKQRNAKIGSEDRKDAIRNSR